jgi:excisionase family DNA binding protein
MSDTWSILTVTEAAKRREDERLTLSVPEVAARLGLSRNGAYEAVAAGQIPSIRIGRRVLVPRVALDRLLDQAGPKAA